MTKRFDVKFTIEVTGDTEVHPEEIKTFLMRKIDDFDFVDEDDETHHVEAVDYWSKATVIPQNNTNEHPKS